MSENTRMLLSGNEAAALAARHVGVAIGTAYPGTPSTEIMEHFAKLGGHAQWSPNEKVAYEVALGAAFGGVRALAAMKHVGVNVAADPLFTSTYTGVAGALVLISADDPGMASSQNEQDNRRYAVAAGIPMLEPSDSQESYDFLFLAYEISERWRIPVMMRMTTRVCHSRTIVRPRAEPLEPLTPRFEHDIKGRVMIPGYARPAHRRLRTKLNEIYKWNEESGPNRISEGEPALGIITSGVCYVHAREAAPEARILKLGMTHPLPMERITEFAESVARCVVIEENDPYLADAVRAAGMEIESKPDMYRFDELNVARVRRVLSHDLSAEPVRPPGKPPQLCPGCPHRLVMAILHKHDCIISGDIGCYTLAALPPLEAHDSCVCMGASVTVGLGLRHALPPEDARRVVSVIGDSTFVHSGITGLVEMVYNPPPTGHVVIILDNGTTAMTGMQEHPGTGRTLDHRKTGQVVFEELAKTLGVKNVHVMDPSADVRGFEKVLLDSLATDDLTLIVARKPCILAAKKKDGVRVSGIGFRSDTRHPTPDTRHRGKVTNVVFAGLGGQGVLKASDILAEAAFRSGLDVKKSEIHGMSQRGGSVTSDVRYGAEVFSSMAPDGEADFLVVLESTQITPARHVLRENGVLLTPELFLKEGQTLDDLERDESTPIKKRTINVALIGLLSTYLDLAEHEWIAAIKANLPEKVHALNVQVFALGRQLAGAQEREG